MSITGTAAQGQHPCWDVRESYCRTDWASTLIHVICMSLVYWCRSLAADYIRGGWCHLAPLVWGQIKCYQAQISSASLAMLQLKNEACLLVGKLLEMKALTYIAICMSGWRINVEWESGGKKDMHTTVKRGRRTKQCGQLLDNSGLQYPPCFTLRILVIKARFYFCFSFFVFFA